MLHGHGARSQPPTISCGSSDQIKLTVEIGPAAMEHDVRDELESDLRENVLRGMIIGIDEGQKFAPPPACRYLQDSPCRLGRIAETTRLPHQSVAELETRLAMEFDFVDAHVAEKG